METRNNKKKSMDWHLTAASIKAVTDEFQLSDKANSRWKLNNMKKTFVLQTPHMKKSRPEKN